MNHPERAFTCAVADWMHLALPDDAAWTHFPAGEKRSAKTGALLKRYGTMAGMPDFIVWWQGRSFGIELKSPGGRLSPAQKAMHGRLLAAGVQICIAHRFEAVESFLQSVGMPLKTKSRRCA